MSDAHPFESARKFEHELSARQREILGMLAAGRTNAEIASAFDMTQDGAKWHVGEIYSKLGLASREEAAAYWHWRMRMPVRFQSLARGLVGLSPLKLLAGAGVLAIAGVVLAFVLLRGDEDDVEFDHAFSLEVRVEQPGEPPQTVRFWYGDERHRRWVRESGDEPALAQVADGTSWFASDESKPREYRQWPIETALAPASVQVRQAQLLSGGLVGTRLESLDAASLAFRSGNTFENPSVRRLDDGELLGRAVAVFESGPMSTGPFATPDGDVLFTIRAKVDIETLAIIGWETVLPGGGLFTITPTDFDDDPSFKDGAFVFSPPADATRLPGLVDAAMDAAGARVPAGALAIVDLPAGLVSLATEAEDYGGIYSLSTWLGEPGGQAGDRTRPFVSIRQGLAADGEHEMLVSSRVPVLLENGLEGTLTIADDGGLLVLDLFIPAGLATIETNVFGADAFLAWAETLELR